MISDATWALFIQALPGIITALIGSIFTGIILMRKSEVIVGEARTAVVEAKAALVENKQAVVTMEKQINSNMEKQMKQAVAQAIAEERLKVNVEKTAREERAATSYNEGMAQGNTDMEKQMKQAVAQAIAEERKKKE